MKFYLLVNKVPFGKTSFDPGRAKPLAIFECEGPGPGRRAVHGKEGQGAGGRYLLETRDATDTLKILQAKHPALPVVTTAAALFELASA